MGQTVSAARGKEGKTAEKVKENITSCVRQHQVSSRHVSDEVMLICIPTAVDVSRDCAAEPTTDKQNHLSERYS